MDGAYTGSRDNEGKPHGRGTLMWETGDRFEGRFIDGVKNGRGCYYFADGSSLQGLFVNDYLTGLGTYTFEDGSSQSNFLNLEGQYVDGDLNGPAQEFDSYGQLVFQGYYKNNVRCGMCCLYDEHGGHISGDVDESGALTGYNITHWYPGCMVGLQGQFKEATFVSGYEVQMSHDHVETVSSTIYHRDVSTRDCISQYPMLPDPYESKTVYVDKSSIAGEGLFAVHDLQPDTVVSFYNGIRLTHREVDERDWQLNSNTISLDSETVIDVPEEYSSTASYCASLGHKANHSFSPNCRYCLFEHPRFGLIKCIKTICSVRQHEELTVAYEYDHQGVGGNAPEWYKLETLKSLTRSTIQQDC